MALQELSEPQHMTEDEYLAFEEKSEIRHEYVDGHIRAMTGATYNHNVICGNAVTEFNTQLAAKRCKAMSGTMRVKVDSSHVSYRYPDVVVVCGKPAYFKNRKNIILNPAVIVEVLSNSTQTIDTREKLAEYTKIDSLQAYILIAQDTPRVECYRLSSDGDWQFQLLESLDDVLKLPSLSCELSLASLYDLVEWDDTSHPEADESDDID